MVTPIEGTGTSEAVRRAWPAPDARPHILARFARSIDVVLA